MVTTTEHNPDTCAACKGGCIDELHCWEHGYEPIIGIPYMVCWERGHSYQTGDDLVEADRMTYEEMRASPWMKDPCIAGWTDLPPWTMRLPGEIPFCPLCLHDF